MKKIVFILLILPLFWLSCQHKPSIHQMRQESLATGIHSDTLFGNLTIRLSRSEVFNALNIREGEKYYFSVASFANVGFDVYPHFFNDSLFGVTFSSFDRGYRRHIFSDIVNAYTLIYGKADTTFTTRERNYQHTYHYWFNGNIEIQLSKLEREGWNSIYIEYEDFSRGVVRDIVIRSEGISRFYYTREYYNSVVLPRKREEIEGVI